jgi:hypothetical protein
MLGRTSADAGYYDEWRQVFKSNGSRVAMTGGIGIGRPIGRRVALLGELRVVPRGFVSGEDWMNASYLDAAFTGSVFLRAPSRTVRPYATFGLSGGLLIDCARGGFFAGTGYQRDRCESTNLARPEVARFHAAREIGFGIRFRTPPRDVDVELAHSRTLGEFMDHATGLDAKHRVWSLRVRACVVNCRP